MSKFPLNNWISYNNAKFYDNGNKDFIEHRSKSMGIKRKIPALYGFRFTQNMGAEPCKFFYFLR